MEKINSEAAGGMALRRVGCAHIMCFNVQNVDFLPQDKTLPRISFLWDVISYCKATGRADKAPLMEIDCCDLHWWCTISRQRFRIHRGEQLPISTRARLSHHKHKLKERTRTIQLEEDKLLPSTRSSVRKNMQTFAISSFLVQSWRSDQIRNCMCSQPLFKMCCE